ncbi:MAG: hypothetical protein IPL55_02425 [Saprospiraceae bacterium]|nr:hypothetical protein [Saprospiraceae bacterium]
MNNTIKNVLGVVAGAILGGLVNGGIISISSKIIPPPEGAILTTMEGLKASMSLMEPKHFIMPFLAHAIGTLVGAALGAYIAAKHKMQVSLIIGFLFFLGGFSMVFSLPSPFWFNALDLIFAYFPMAWIGGMIGSKLSKS